MKTKTKSLFCIIFCRYSVFSAGGSDGAAAVLEQNPDQAEPSPAVILLRRQHTHLLCKGRQSQKAQVRYYSQLQLGSSQLQPPPALILLRRQHTHLLCQGRQDQIALVRYRKLQLDIESSSYIVSSRQLQLDLLLEGSSHLIYSAKMGYLIAINQINKKLFLFVQY